MSRMNPPVMPADQRVQPDGDDPDRDDHDQRGAAGDLQGLVGEVLQPFVGLVLQADGEQQRGDPEDGVDQRLGQALGDDERGAHPVLLLEQPVPPQQHLAGLPEGQREHAEADRPEQGVSGGPVGDGLQGAGLVGVVALPPPRETQREPGDQEVHQPVRDESQPGDVRQERVIGDLAGPVDRAVHPLEQGPPGTHVRSGYRARTRQKAPKAAIPIATRVSRIRPNGSSRIARRAPSRPRAFDGSKVTAA